MEDQKDLITTDINSLVAIAENSEKRMIAIKTIKTNALRVTSKNDWIDQAGKPYLQSSGAEKIARVFQISWEIDEPVFEQFEDGHYQYTYKGKFSIAGVPIEAIGTRNSRDSFFKKYEKQSTEDYNAKKDKKELPPSMIDRGDVKKSAYSNLLVNGITRLIGLRNLTYEDLATINITKEMITGFEYKKSDQSHSKQANNDLKISEAQRKKFYAVYKNAGKTDDEVKKYLLSKYKVEHSADILKAQFNEILQWAESKNNIDWLALTEQAGTIQDRAEWERFKAENKIDENIGSVPDEFKIIYNKCQAWQK